jgi:hypothetical protein
VPNTLLTELPPQKAEETITEKMRKDLKEAFLLAAESNSLEHYKDVLKQFQDELLAKQQAAATPKKSKKGKAKAADEDVDMEDIDDATAEKPKAKKRKAEDDVSVSNPTSWFVVHSIDNWNFRHHSDLIQLRSLRSSLTPQPPRQMALPRPRKNLQPKLRSRLRSLPTRRPRGPRKLR